MSNNKKYIHTVKYTKKDGTVQIKKYDWSKYPNYECEICRKSIGYHSKTKHLRSANHLRLKKMTEELELLKKTQETQTNQTQEPNAPQNN